MKPRRSLLGVAVMFIASLPTQAAVNFKLEEVGSDVVLSGSGTLNLDALNYIGPSTGESVIGPDWGLAKVGQSFFMDFYRLPALAGPSSFGTGPIAYASSTSGDDFGVYGLQGSLMVPISYTSGSPLSGTATFANQTLASLGATVGNYTWTWGSGATADSLSLKVVEPMTAVPEPSAYALALAGLGLLGSWARRQNAHRRQADTAAAGD